MTKDQDELDQHDTNIANLSIRFEELMRKSSSKAESAAYKIASRSLASLRDRLTVISSALTKLSGASEEIHLVDQYQEQVSDLKRELSDTQQNVISSYTHEESDTLNSSIVNIDKLLFDVGLTLKKLAVKAPFTHDKATINSALESKMIKLRKFDIPTFDGNLLHWLTFWEQYCVAIHDRADLSQPQKLVYLWQSLKDGSAKNVIEGLFYSGEQYTEAVKCLQERYNRPRLIHQAHVCKIIEVPSLKDNTGKELRRLHDVLQKHLHALKAMDKDPSASFITSLIEMKLDPDSMFEWQKASQGSADVPHYTKLLEFLNLRAQASESASSKSRKSAKNDHPLAKMRLPNRATSFVTSTSGTASNCVLCKSEKHLLYARTHYKAMSHDRMITVIKDNDLCMNCLKSGHFSKHCSSLSKSQKCQKPHHTFIHINPRESEQGELSSNTSAIQSAISSNTTTGFTPDTLLMTSQILVHSPDGAAVSARALLDSASSTSFISERLAQTLQLPKSSQNVTILGIAGMSHHSPLHSLVSFNISPTSSPSEKIEVTAVAIPRVTSELPELIDVLLGVDIYANVLLHSRRNGPPGSPVAFETKFDWVLAGKTNTSNLLYCSVASHHVSYRTQDLVSYIQLATVQASGDKV